ncbi:MAG: thioredoxin domain-containing protein [Deltaproteobacteria bacterium]|nr:thioredoxin domain-containing protein [Deltaproteobacteria bacterium]
MDRFARALGMRGEGYRPRTRHHGANGWAKYTNRLFLETSPYLLQHAHNPVDWYPWGDEAFEQARRLNRPVFVSIGYSTCHWCHVMEEESFEDEEIARFLNENYIAVKVDREERPDVDAIYMKAVQGFSGTGGWPLNVWLTPERKPFFGGTYFPPRDGRYGPGTGFLEILQALSDSYVSMQSEVEEICGKSTAFIRQALSPKGGGDLPAAEPLTEAAIFYRDHFDTVNGGMAAVPKFPSHLPVRFLLRHHRRTGDGSYLDMARRTLEAMDAGGIHDHVGGGFHRYSTDEKWLVPHFEKMLYDNALLVSAYLEGYQATGREDFARVARETLRFIERDMTAPGGAFYSATDADSLGKDDRREEGAFFTWTPAEIEVALGPERAKIVARYYGVTQGGNFEGRSILHAPDPPAAVARTLGIPEAELETALSEANEILYRERSLRPGPIRDEKILTAWNGLAISAYARAGFILDDPGYVERACRAARFLLANAFRDGRLHRTWKDGEARHPALLEDHAFLVAGFLDLYEASADIAWLEEAVALDAVLADRFEDKDRGGFYLTGDGHEELLVREKPMYDGAEPSGTSVAVLNLLRLHEFTTDPRYRERAEKAFRYAAPTLKSNPITLSEMLLALDFLLDRPKQIVVVLPREAGKDEAAPLLSAFRGGFVPNRILSVVREGPEQEKAARIIPLVRGKEAAGGRATAYVCEGRTCMPPTGDPGELLRQVGTVQPF